MNNYELTPELIQLAEQAGILDLIVWDGNVSNRAYIQRQIEYGVEVPQQIVDFFEAPPLSNIKIYEETTPEYRFDNATGQYFFIEPKTKLKVSKTVYESGFGINNSSVQPGDYMRRFNGMALNNKTAMARPYPIVITEITCCSDSANEGAYFDCLHYAMDGSDEFLVGRLLFTMQQSQMAAAWLNISVLIPAYRRITIRVGGNNISSPQGYYKYRQVIM